MPLLLHRVAARVACLLHARLSPLTFLLNLSLLTLLLRILLSLLPRSPSLHTLLSSTNTALQGLKLHSPDANLFESRIALVVLSNCIILVLLFSAKGVDGSSIIQSGFDDADAEKARRAFGTAPPNEAAIASVAPSTMRLDKPKPCAAHRTPSKSLIISEENSGNRVASMKQIKYTAAAACKPSTLISRQVELAPTSTAALAHANSSYKGLIRQKSDGEIGNPAVANKYAKYWRTASGTCYYYEYAREGACSTARLYTASSIDSLSKEGANQQFSDFLSRKWARIRTESQADCEASSPLTALVPSVCA